MNSPWATRAWIRLCLSLEQGDVTVSKAFFFKKPQLKIQGHQLICVEWDEGLGLDWDPIAHLDGSMAPVLACILHVRSDDDFADCSDMAVVSRDTGAARGSLADGGVP